MALPVALRRQALRLAYRLLRVYWFIARPQTHGVKCILTDGDRILLVGHTYGDHYWDLPGGAIKRGEQPVSAARREMQEELGLTIEDWREVGQTHATKHYRHDTVHCFLASVHAPRLTIDRGEIDDAAWFALDQLPPETGPWTRKIIAMAQLDRDAR